MLPRREAHDLDGERRELVDDAVEVGLFRGESLLGTHGGMGSLIGHLERSDDGRLDVTTRRSQPERAGVAGYLAAAALVSVLAAQVFEEFGVSIVEVVQIAHRIGAVQA